MGPFLAAKHVHVRSDLQRYNFKRASVACAMQQCMPGFADEGLAVADTMPGLSGLFLVFMSSVTFFRPCVTADPCTVELVTDDLVRRTC